VKSQRVYELAREFGVESKLVLRILGQLGFSVSSAASQVPAEALSPLRNKIIEHGSEPTESDRELSLADSGTPLSDVDSRARDLIIKAFEAARRGGRPDWQTMTVAVLKNRLLNVSDRSFREKDYGARTVGEFVRRYPDLLLLDDSSQPAKVRLRTTNIRSSTPGAVEQSRIRPDLWSAIVDYQSGFTYVWDGLIAQPMDASAARGAKEARVLPTLDRDELDAWRSEFLSNAQDLIGADHDATEQARRWARDRLGTRYLPASLRTPWNHELKRRVVDRLTSWFAREGLSAPADLLRARPVGRTQYVGADTLRQLVLRCVHVMTEDELRQLSLPPSAVLRAYGTAVPGKGQGGL
jgi:hypothetical protein